MYNVAIILGAGNGTRMGIDKSKMLIEIGGRAVIQRSVEAFCELAEIDEIIVVCRECDVQSFSSLLPYENVSFVIGGKTRQESVRNAVETIDSCDYILIHDGARPLVTERVIINTLDQAMCSKAAAAGVFVKDTVKVVDGERNIVGTPDRSNLVLIQTPQVFEFSTYRKALAKAVEQGKDYTDDCQLVENLGMKVKTVHGDYSNIKITTACDIAIAEGILAAEENEI